MLAKNYTPLNITIKNNKIFVLGRHHRFLIMCVENNIELNYTLKEINE